MAFGGQMHHRVRLMGVKNAVERCPVPYVGVFKRIER